MGDWTRLQDLSDVNSAGITDLAVPVWNATTKKWDMVVHAAESRVGQHHHAQIYMSGALAFTDGAFNYVTYDSQRYDNPSDDQYTPIVRTGNTHTNTTLDNLSQTSDLLAGMSVVGSGVPVGTTISSIQSSSSLTLSAATTSTLTGTSITFNSSRLYCKQAGFYLFTANLIWAAATTPVGYRYALLYMNRASVVGVSNMPAVSTASTDTRQSLSGTYRMAVNDYIEVLAVHKQGATLNLNNAEMSMSLITT